MPRRPCIGLPSFVSIDLCMALATLTYGRACDICGRDSAVLGGNSSNHVRTVRWRCNTSESRVTTYIGPLTPCSSLIQSVNVPNPDRTYAVFGSGPKESRATKCRVSINGNERGCGTTSLAALQCPRQPCMPKTSTGHFRRSVLADKASQHASVLSLGLAYGHSSKVCQRMIPSKYPLKHGGCGSGVPASQAAPPWFAVARFVQYGLC